MAKKNCTVEGCAGVVKARGYCTRHYNKWKRHGDPLFKSGRCRGFRPEVKIVGSHAEVPLWPSGIAIIDVEDALTVGKWSWYLYRTRNSEYACSGCGRMHRLILGLPKGQRPSVDHINGNGLDNRRSNLRLCTVAQNLYNRGPQKNNKSGFKGVYKRSKNCWGAGICVNKVSHDLGYFSNPEDAARAYDEAAKRLHGEFARLNFGE